MNTSPMLKTLTPETKLCDGQSAPMISRPSRPTTGAYDSFDSGSTILEQSFITLNARPSTGSPTLWCIFISDGSPQRHSAAKAATKGKRSTKLHEKTPRHFVLLSVISWIVVSVKTLLKKQEISDLYQREHRGRTEKTEIRTLQTGHYQLVVGVVIMWNTIRRESVALLLVLSTVLLMFLTAAAQQPTEKTQPASGSTDPKTA